jgi:hypothetical protein
MCSSSNGAHGYTHAMARRHAARPGESIDVIAEAYGWSPEALWNASEQLRQKRRNRNVLEPGDVVVIPVLTRFQRRHQLPETGELDEPTRRKLEELHVLAQEHRCSTKRRIVLQDANEELHPRPAWQG